MPLVAVVGVPASTEYGARGVLGAERRPSSRNWTPTTPLSSAASAVTVTVFCDRGAGRRGGHRARWAGWCRGRCCVNETESAAAGLLDVAAVRDDRGRPCGRRRARRGTCRTGRRRCRSPSSSGRRRGWRCTCLPSPATQSPGLGVDRPSPRCPAMVAPAAGCGDAHAWPGWSRSTVTGLLVVVRPAVSVATAVMVCGPLSRRAWCPSSRCRARWCRPGRGWRRRP